LRIHLKPAVARERLTQQAAMLDQRVVVGLGAELLQEPSRSLDVREEEGDGANGEVTTHGRHDARTCGRRRVSAVWGTTGYQAFGDLRLQAGFAGLSLSCVHALDRDLPICSDFMERTGIEPVTFGLQSRRSPS
jgi:hypothetical protein